MSTITAAHDLDHQVALAEAFAALHTTDSPLVLPNAWDAGSAYLIEQAGAKAVATTSGGRAWSVGVADGGGLSRDQAVALIRDISRVVKVPITADVERGYGDTLDELRSSIAAVISAGAVGINIEDSGGDPLYTPEEQAERIAAARAAADAFGLPLFINARTDVYLFGVGEESGRLDDVIARARVYAAAGANGLFVPGLLDLDTLRTLTAAVNLPVNVMVGPGAPAVAQLAEAGVRRISAGTALVQSAYAHTQRAAREMMENGTFASLEAAIDYGAINGALARERDSQSRAS
jgi:2-methylisocitrate lyase-like PEP mutase family enzyme